MHICLSNHCFSVPAINRPVGVILCADCQILYIYRHSQYGVFWTWFLYQFTTHFPMAQQPLAGQGLLINEALWSHSDTPHSVGLLWTSDQPYAETWQPTQHSQKADIHVPGGIWTHNPSKLQTHAFDHAATGIDLQTLLIISKFFTNKLCQFLDIKILLLVLAAVRE